ncbi:hypothetical protein [Sorangium sp. So ce1024]|uniref:hypothetical protein n=1 Tax=Sorangium sp. So ce1024 TaxID=3133327 RepID=UPI003F0ABECD
MTRSPPAVLSRRHGAHGGQRDGGYWTASGRVIFEPARFYLPVEAVDPFGEHSFVTYDDFALLVETTTDPLNDLVQVERKYGIETPCKPERSCGRLL